MSKLSRRRLLEFFGCSAAATVLAPTVERKLWGGNSSVAQAVQLPFTPVRLPHPLPIYRTEKSFLPTGIGSGSILNPVNDVRLGQYEAYDDVIVPPEYERYVLISWGDRVFPDQQDYFGYNCDFTGYVGSSTDGYLWVNHEYVSYPFAFLSPGTLADVEPFPQSFDLVVGFSLPKATSLTALSAGDRRLVLGESLYNVGGSVVRISRSNRRDRFAVVAGDAKNRRLHGLSGLGVNSQRSDAYRSVTSWGSRSYQQGDENYLIGTGPAASEVFSISADGLGNKIIGTGFNCSGGVTPWGTILSAEENFQGSAAFYIGVTETVKSDGTQTGYTSGTSGAEFGQVGEKYGWMVEIDPANPGFRPRKHTWLGRFRHENIAVRVQAGKKLVGYMGDDRRGGHTWKFVSSGTVTNPKAKSNSQLFENGILYVAKFNPPSDPTRPNEGTGEWIPLLLNTPTNPIPPSVLASTEIAALGTAQRNGLINLPRRNGVAGQTVDGGFFGLTTVNEATALPDYRNKTLVNFYASQGAILCDAYPAANLVGGTPTARPEDIEINPRNSREIFISYTDGAPGSDGYPDSRVFVVAKYTTAASDTQQSGGIYKIIENSADGTGTTFRWQRFVQGGEAGSEDGAGFANVDNLVFDNRGHIWGVTDMSTDLHNGFNVGAAGTPTTINHAQSGNVSSIVGVFGNNWLFYVPTDGPMAGELVPFAYGPPRCEMTGPTFVGDTLIISVQHPGEDCPYTPQQTLSRTIEMLNLDGTLFNQQRSVPRGSNWPSNLQGNAGGPPKPSVIGIRRKRSNGQFV